MATPSTPQNLSITTGNGQVYLTWQQVVGATSYSIQRSPSGIVGTFVDLGTATVDNYLDAAVTSGQSYWYQVASVNASGTSPYATLAANNLPLMAVPCLPGQINLGYLKYQAKLRSDMLYSQFLTEDEWDFNINQSANRLYDLLITKFGEKYFLAAPLAIPTTGSEVYALPDGLLYDGAPALYKLAGVDAGVNATNNQWFSLPKFNWIDRNRYSTLQIAGTVQSIYGLAYCDFGNNLYLIPTPTTAQTIQLWYIPRLTQMLRPTDMMPFSISGWSELVIVDAAIKALIKEESYDQASSLINERSELLERITVSASNRDVGQPNTISNTRARVGDPNFGGSMGGFSGWGNNGGN